MDTAERLNLIVVDDEFIERDGIRKLTAALSLPFDVTLAADGEEAYNALTGGYAADVMITDIRMPFMDGLTLSAKAHALLPNLQIIIYSAYDEFEYARQAITAGVSEYLLKPIESDAFDALMRRVIERCRDIRRKAEDERQLQSAYDRLQALEARRKLNASLSSNMKTDNPVIRAVLEIIQNEYTHDIGLEYIAEKVSRTPGYISNLFKCETGVSLVKYLTQYRMARACELLRDSTVKVVNISRAVGYQNPTYFGQLFKSIYGVTPIEYREDAPHE